jgi:O-antigen/teichoic acid export membrane protein
LKLKSLSYVFVGLTNNLISFITLPLFLSKIPVYDYGLAGTFFAGVSILSILTGLSIHMSIRASFYDYETESYSFLKSVILLNLLSTFFFLIVSLLLIQIFRIKINFDLLLFSFLTSITSNIITNYSTFLMMKKKVLQRSFLLFFPNILSVFFSLILLYFFLESDFYLSKIIPPLIINSLISLIILWKLYFSSKEKIKVSFFKYSLKISIPLMFHALGLIILSQSDRIMISWLYNIEESAIYTLIYNLGFLLSSFYIGFDGVWIPWFMERYKNKDYNLLNNISNYYINAIASLSIIFMYIFPEFLQFLSPEPYWTGIYIAPLIITSNFILFAYTFYVTIEHISKKTTIIALNTFLASSINIILNLILIPIYGMYAAAFTTFLSYLVSFTIHYFTSRRIDPNYLSFNFILEPFLIINLSLLLYFFILDYLLLRIVFIFFIGLYYFFKFKVFNLLKKKL